MQLRQRTMFVIFELLFLICNSPRRASPRRVSAAEGRYDIQPMGGQGRGFNRALEHVRYLMNKCRRPKWENTVLPHFRLRPIVPIDIFLYKTYSTNDKKTVTIGMTPI